MNVVPSKELTREQFMGVVRASGLLSDRQWDAVERALTPFQKTAREVAEFLVKQDWLTKFQASRLLQGKSDGFLLGPYVVREFRTRTHTACVYQAIHRTMNRAVEVAVLRTSLTATGGMQDAIRMQARCAARLAHPNVLTLLDVNTAGDRMYLVHEFVDGTDAGRLIREGGTLSVPRACEFIRQASLGLQHAHDRQVVHGRLCPPAVLIGRPGGNGPLDKPVVKVSGLGLGEFLRTEGAEAFAVPELSTSPTPTADLFSLGGVLHYLLTGRPPHPATPIRVLRPDLPPTLTALLSSLLHTNPSHRPASAQDVANVLAAFAGEDTAQIDFGLPSSHGSLTGGTTASGASLPVGVRLPVASDNSSTPTPLAEPALQEATDVNEETPVSSQAVYTPIFTVRTRQQGKRRGTRTRRQEQQTTLWLGVIVATVVLAAAGLAIAVLAAVVKG